MPRVKYSVEQIIPGLRESEVLLGQGQTVKDICRKWNITDPAYYRWRQKYGGLKLDQAKTPQGFGTRECPVEASSG